MEIVANDSEFGAKTHQANSLAHLTNPDVNPESPNEAVSSINLSNCAADSTSAPVLSSPLKGCKRPSNQFGELEYSPPTATHCSDRENFPIKNDGPNLVNSDSSDDEEKNRTGIGRILKDLKNKEVLNSFRALKRTIYRRNRTVQLLRNRIKELTEINYELTTRIAELEK